MDRRQLVDHVRQVTPQDLGQWFAQNPEVADLLDDVYHQGTRFLISEHTDALRRIERGYGTATRPEDYLDSFRRFITEHVDQIPALLVVTQRPPDLTRAQLRELRLQLDPGRLQRSAPAYSLARDDQSGHCCIGNRLYSPCGLRTALAGAP